MLHQQRAAAAHDDRLQPIAHEHGGRQAAEKGSHVVQQA